MKLFRRERLTCRRLRLAVEQSAAELYCQTGLRLHAPHVATIVACRGPTSTHSTLTISFRMRLQKQCALAARRM